MNNKTKILTVFPLMMILFLLYTPVVSACEISVEQLQPKQETVNINDTVIVSAKVKLVHRFCPHAIDHTEYNAEGVKILAATPWKEDDSGSYIRKFKLVIEDNEEGKHVLTVFRTCDKGGDKVDFTFKIDSEKEQEK